ncbi:MAG: Crp/Fnr family transcriptional regulator [Pyrinomonadaceae bacterium]
MQIKNRLLAALPVETYESLLPHFEEFSFVPGDILFQAGDKIRHVYFPGKGMISLLSVTEQGQAIELGYSSREGMVGLPIILGRDEMPYQAMAQADTDCLRIDSRIIVSYFRRGEMFQDVLLRYVSALMKQISQTGVCNHFHTIEARLCRWLLVMFEHSDTNILRLTQEFFSHMLGVQRTSVGLVAGTLQSAGIIRYSRGKIELLDRNKMKAWACECYFIVKKEYDHFLDF